VKDIVAISMGMRRSAGKRGLAGLAALGIVVIAGLLAAWGVSPGESFEISPADVVALRFPPDWNNDETTGSVPVATFALASASSSQVETSMLFNPSPTVPSADAPSIATPQPVISPAAASEPKQDIKSDAKKDPKPSVVVTRSLAPAPAPERRAAPAPRKDSGTLFNDAQLASIKTRLKLSEYQEQYWPPVASALKAIGWRASHASKSTSRGSATRLAEIDGDSDEVQQLKSAAFPLIMSMNEDQKSQVRMIAHVMGLEQVASSF
jgi:hypothetical protein